MAFLPVNVSGAQERSFVELPEGNYYLRIATATTKENSKGTGYVLTFECEVVMGPGESTENQGRKVWHRLNLINGADWSRDALFTFSKVCGIPQAQIDSCGGNVDSDWFLGKEFIGSLKKRSYTDNSGNTKTGTEIKGERPVATWRTQATATPVGPNLLNPAPAPVAPVQAFAPVYTPPPAAPALVAQAPVAPAYMPATVYGPSPQAYAPPTQTYAPPTLPVNVAPPQGATSYPAPPIPPAPVPQN